MLKPSVITDRNSTPQGASDHNTDKNTDLSGRNKYCPKYKQPTEVII